MDYIELAGSIAEQEGITVLSKIMRLANDLAENELTQPFSEAEIRMTTFFESQALTQHELNLLAIQQDFNKAYFILHNDVAIFKKELYGHSLDIVKSVYKSLLAENQVELLTNGLSKKVIKYAEEKINDDT